MNKLNKIRLPLDIMMTILSIILMGGNFLFPAEIVHEIMGVGLFVLWGVHIALNRRWYSLLAQASVFFDKPLMLKFLGFFFDSF